MPRRSLLAALLGLGAACSPAPPASAPPPPGAAEIPLSGGDEARIRQAVSDLRMALPEGQTLQLKHYRLPNGAAWPSVTRHYDQVLGPSWKPDPRLPEARGGYHARAWRMRDGRAVFVAAVIEGEAPGHVLVAGLARGRPGAAPKPP